MLDLWRVGVRQCLGIIKAGGQIEMADWQRVPALNQGAPNI